MSTHANAPHQPAATTDRIQSLDSPSYQAANISANNFEDCIKCTICTVYCPVTPINPDFPGPKQAGPDGERYRLKKPQYYDEALNYCLNCKRCEVACPSNVRIGDIIQSARLRYSRRAPTLRDRMLASTDLVGGLATPLAAVVNGMLSLRPVKVVLDKVMGIDCHRQMPTYSPTTFASWHRRHAQAAQAAYPRQVSYFHGCYVNYNFPRLGQDLVAVMNALGFGVQLLTEERCCGVAKIANKLMEAARRDAAINIAAIRRSVAEGREVLTTSSTCTLTMRDEYSHILGLDTADVRNHLQLATRFIYGLIDRGDVKVAFKPGFRRRVAYHTPCHMEKLGWAIYSTSLLRLIPGLDFVPLESACCGIAGTYGFKRENYAYSQQIGQALFDQIAAAKVDCVATDCETCKWQIEMSTGVAVDNPISIFADALDIDRTRSLNGLPPRQHPTT